MPGLGLLVATTAVAVLAFSAVLDRARAAYAWFDALVAPEDDRIVSVDDVLRTVCGVLALWLVPFSSICFHLLKWLAPTGRLMLYELVQIVLFGLPARTAFISQTAGAFCFGGGLGGRALGLRSEGSWLAAELLRAGLQPGADDRCAGWVGLSPSQPCPRCAPARPECAAARARTPTLPVPARHEPSYLPHSITKTVPRFVQVSTRAFERGAVRLWGRVFS